MSASSRIFRGICHRFIAAVAAALVVMAAVPSDAYAQVANEADEAQVQFLLGNDAYLRGDFRGALAHWFASNRLAPNRNVVFNIGRAYDALGESVEAYRYFQLAADGATEDSERRAIEAAMRKTSEAVALLDLRTEPAGAVVYLDRRDLGAYGTTPRLLPLPTGTYKVILELEGYEPLSLSGIEVKRGERTELRPVLSRILGTVQLEGEPAGAEVKLQGPTGPVVGALPCSIDLPPGEHILFVSAPGHVSTEFRLRLEPKESLSVAVGLERQRGALVVQADERDALVIIDGRPAGFTPVVIDGIPAGDHEVEVTLPGFRPYRETVVVEPEGRVLVEVDLSASEDVAAASRAVESVADAPASVSVVPAREIRALGAFTVAEAVAGERGLFLSDDGTYTSLGVRGFAPFGQYGNRVLVQIDGHSLNDDWVGSSFVGFDLMAELEALDRIEIVRGPGSVLYGTGAFLGVVNLVTRTDIPRSPGWVGGSVVGDGKFRGAAGMSVALGEDGGAWISGGGTYGQREGYSSPSRLGSVQSPDGVARDVGGSESGSAQLKVWWKDLTVQGFFNQRERGVPTGSFDTLFGDGRTIVADRRAFGEIRWAPQLTDDLSLLARASYDHVFYEGRFAYAPDDGGVLEEEYNGHWTTVELRARWKPLDQLRLDFGVEHQFHFGNQATGSDEAGEVYLDESHPYHVVSASALVDWAPVQWLSASAGVRFDGWWISDLPKSDGTRGERFMQSLNPRAAVVLRPWDDGAFKAMFGRAFRAPSVYELTYWDGGVTQIQSPDLDPETIYTGELEYAHKLGAGYTLIGTVYTNVILDLIEQVGEGSSDDPLHYVNSAKNVYTLGGEVELSTEFERGYMLSIQYGLQASRRGAFLGDEEITNSPTHLVGFKLIAPIARPELLIANRIVVDAGRLDRLGETTGAAVVWDLALSGQVAPAKLRYAVGARNLLDWRYGHPVGSEILDPRVRQPGRTFFADFQFYW